MNGFICIDKPSGPSSFAAAQIVRRALGVKKVGHAGTLDPMASGLLVVALGNCTRLLEYLPLEPKNYDFSVTFGKSTDTLDAQGNVTAESDAVPSEDQLKNALKKFCGEIEQIPPQYSAIKINGARAYELARKGIAAEMKPRAVTVYSIDMTGYDGDEKRADFTVSCSSGTYVRSIARDIVKTANPDAEGFVNKLRRVKTGFFDLSIAVDLQTLQNAKDKSRPLDVENYIINTGAAFDGRVKITVSNEQRAEISCGKKIFIDKDDSGDILIAFDENGALVSALKRVDHSWYHPAKVFIT